MTRQDGSSAPPPSGPASDGDYTRKLALAILSTLQSRGLLSAADVDAILIAARRSAHQAMQTQSTQGQSVPRTEVPLAAMHVTAQPSPSQVGVSWHTTAPPADASGGSLESSEKSGEAQAVAETSGAQAKEEVSSPSEASSPDAPQPGEKQPPLFDIKLD